MPKERKSPKKRKVEVESEETDSASEIEEGHTPKTRSVKIQVTSTMPCEHAFSVNALQHLCENGKKHAFKFHTGFNNLTQFMTILTFLLPDLDRSNIRYYESRTKVYSTATKIMDSDSSSSSDEETDTDEEESRGVERETKFHVTDEFLIVLMKLWMGLKHMDLACRFKCSVSTISPHFYHLD